MRKNVFTAIFWSGAVYALALGIFVYTIHIQTSTHIISDIPIHVKFISQFAKNNKFPLYSIYYLLIYILSGFSRNLITLSIVAVVVLATSVVFKYILTKGILQQNKHSYLWAFLLIIAMPIYNVWNNYHFYLGQISLNQWHNSTLILAMPFNILLFSYAVNNIKNQTNKNTTLIALLSIVSLACKPNFVMVFLPAYLAFFILSNWKFVNKKRLISQLAVILVPVVLFLMLQYYYTYVHNNLFPHASKIIVAPFLAWGYCSKNIPISLILSIAFPISVLIMYFKKIDLNLLIAWLTFVVALLVMILFAEYPSCQSGNFFWGAMAACYVLFLYSLRFLLQQPRAMKQFVCFLFFALHTISGAVYIIHFFLFDGLLYC